MSGFNSYDSTDSGAPSSATTEMSAAETHQAETAMTPTGQRLRAYIDRVERLEEDKKAVSEDIKEVFAEAKGDGFDIKAIKKIISLRKKDPADRAEEESILETYKAAIGMD